MRSLFLQNVLLLSLILLLLLLLLPSGPAIGAVRDPASSFGLTNSRHRVAGIRSSSADAVGKIVCRHQWGTAFLVGKSTVVTGAHVLGRSDRSGAVLPERCRFLVVQNGKVVDRIELVHVASSWGAPSVGSDVSQDIAIVTLARAPATSIEPLAVALSGAESTDIYLEAYHDDLTHGHHLYRSSGRLITPPQTGFLAARIAAAQGYVIGRPDRLRVSDFDAGYGSSGGPIRDALTHAVIGINHGRQVGIHATPAFNPAEHYNLVVLFDRDMLSAMIPPL